MPLSDETWIVTGASRGIGAALAAALAEEGAQLILNARNVERLEAARSFVPHPERVRIVAGDIGDPDTARRVGEAAHALGGPIGLVHNAAVAAPGPKVWELDAESHDQVLGASVDGAMHLIRVLVPTMRRAGSGCLVFVGSGLAERNALGMGAYSLAKAAEEHLARQIALEAPELVSFVWRPGVVDTDMQAEARSAPPEVAAMFEQFRDSGRLITPAQAAADLLGHLVGDRTALNGTTVSVG